MAPLPPVPKLYLLAYNTFQLLGWAISLFSILRSAASARSSRVAYAASGDLIYFLQTLAVLEVLHAVLGIVPSGVALALMQWGGRTHFLLAVVRNIEEIQELPAVFITFIAWGISEIIRYSHYALTSIGVCPSWLTYLRYTAFIFLYPIGVFPGEMWLMYQALPVIKQKNLYSNLFGKVSSSYHSFITVLLVCYPFLWLNLYLHLFKQRRSKLGKGKKKKQ